VPKSKSVNSAFSKILVMKAQVEIYSGTYQHYSDEVYRQIRQETWGEDIGQNSWLTADEYRSIFKLLGIDAGTKVLEIASGSGGPALFMTKETGCEVVGIDINENGIANANALAKAEGLNLRAEFLLADASQPLPFESHSFDVVVSMDSLNHINHRGDLLKECFRIMKPGGRLLYTDPCVITGIVTNEELAVRSSIGFFLFMPHGENERMMAAAGFENINNQDVTENIAAVTRAWHDARARHEGELLLVESESNFTGMQMFLQTTNLLTSQRRLSRIRYMANRPV
jgi:ubiquinone/menaquinone biosynthesis C-methylase UbiE